MSVLAKVEVRGQLMGVGFLLPPCRSSVCQASQQIPSSTEPCYSLHSDHILQICLFFILSFENCRFMILILSCWFDFLVIFLLEFSYIF